MDDRQKNYGLKKWKLEKRERGEETMGNRGGKNVTKKKGKKKVGECRRWKIE